MEALWERNCIRKNKKGLVFAVGNEPLPLVFAKYGCSVLATDIHPAQGEKLGWANNHELCYGLDSLNERGVCPDQIFRENVRYAAVDMNHIPKNLGGFDFNWSSCSFEHLGSIERGLNFLKNQIDTLTIGGWAVHTTEFNISSDDVTLDKNENTVIFRRKDIENVVGELRAMGHFVEEVDYSLGGLPEDFHVDTFPYHPDNHIRLQLDKFIVTSIGLIIQKKKFKKRTFWFLSGKD
jgi:hypothetical protein